MGKLPDPYNAYQFKMKHFLLAYPSLGIGYIPSTGYTIGFMLAHLGFGGFGGPFP
jgi:hypothetical protein